MKGKRERRRGRERVNYACGQLDRRMKQDDERSVEREKVRLVAQRKKND